MDCCKYSFQDYVFAIFIRFCQHRFCFVYVQHVSRSVMLVSVSWLGLVILVLTCYLFCEISYCENFILVIVLSLFSQLVSCLFWHSRPSLSFIDILCLATCLEILLCSWYSTLSFHGLLVRLALLLPFQRFPSIQHINLCYEFWKLRYNKKYEANRRQAAMWHSFSVLHPLQIFLATEMSVSWGRWILFKAFKLPSLFWCVSFKNV